jgi:pimeloyl-ACP methyl ester carboxylesterase
MPTWHPRDWAAGLDAQQMRFPLSAFKVLDDLLLKLTDESGFPGVTTLTLAGHSAGGQLIQRYAVLNPLDEQIRSRGLELRYVVANPSSFLYLTPQRPDGKTFKDYAAEQCPDFNQYRYGLENIIPYAAGKTSQELFKRYSHRSVIYLMGMQDTNPNHRLLDKTCPALAQGPTRLSRAQAYVRYERFLAGRAARINHLAYQVAGVGHEQAKMFGSACGVRALFQTDLPPDSQPALCVPELF